MAIVATYSETAQRILKMFGVEGKNIREVHIHFVPDSAITMDIVQYAELNGEILDELERKTFILFEKEE